jgi:hypothetical protein
VIDCRGHRDALGLAWQERQGGEEKRREEKRRGEERRGEERVLEVNMSFTARRESVHGNALCLHALQDGLAESSALLP